MNKYIEDIKARLICNLPVPGGIGDCGNRKQEIELFNLQNKAERLRKLYFKNGNNEEKLKAIDATIKRLKDKIKTLEGKP